MINNDRSLSLLFSHIVAVFSFLFILEVLVMPPLGCGGSSHKRLRSFSIWWGKERDKVGLQRISRKLAIIQNAPAPPDRGKKSGNGIGYLVMCISFLISPTTILNQIKVVRTNYYSCKSYSQKIQQAFQFQVQNMNFRYRLLPLC